MDAMLTNGARTGVLTAWRVLCALHDIKLSVQLIRSVAIRVWSLVH
jgi:hypothetical protein